MVKYGKFSNSRADNKDSSGSISSIIKLIRYLMVIYIWTKFGDDWLIFVDAREINYTCAFLCICVKISTDSKLDKVLTT